ncbi:glycosyltransferase [soil metagenome]
MSTPVVLVAALDWGLGHAARSIPLINLLKQRDVKIILGSAGRAAQLWKDEYPELEHIELPAYDPSYPADGNMVWHMALQSKRLLGVIKEEGKALEALITKHGITHVISDNRYGLSNPTVPTAFITHQVNIRMPGIMRLFEPLVNYVNHDYINHFTRCWIPDWPAVPNLSGDLGHGKAITKKRYRYVGPLSRMTATLEVVEQVYEVVALCSGPEPQRSIFEQKLREQLASIPGRKLLVLGKPEIGKTIREENGIEVAEHLGTEAMNEVMQQAKTIVCRSGYSTLMDLNALGLKAILIPTPGQPEQLYLGKRMAKLARHIRQFQDERDLKAGIEKSNMLLSQFSEHRKGPLSTALDELLYGNLKRRVH